MSNRKLNRIVFHSINDGINYRNLQNIDAILNDYENNKSDSINDSLEFYNIRSYLKNGLFLTKWDENTKNHFLEIVEKEVELLKKKLLKISDDDIEQILNELDFEFEENFWDLINVLKVFNNIGKEKFTDILNNYARHIRYILLQKGIVTKFDKEIRQFLINYNESAELILSKFEEKHTLKESPKYFFPKSLSISDKEQIINKYIDYENTNLNYIRLIENSKDSNDLRLSLKTRHKAKKKSIELNNEIFEKGHGWSIRLKIGFSEDQEEPLVLKNSKNHIETIYSEKFLNKFLNDKVSLFYMFNKLFFWTNETNLINLVSKTKQLDVLERIGMKSKNAYQIGQVFQRNEYLSNLQLLGFNNYLNRNDITIENVINSFVEYLNSLINPIELVYKIQESDSSYLEKIRNLIPDYDYFLRQYKYYTEENEVNHELLQLSSKAVLLSEIKSLKEKKYICSDSEQINKLKHLFFSDQSHLFYTDKFGTKYTSLYDLLVNEDVKLNDFSNYQIDTIQSLVDDSYLKVNSDEFIKINKDIQLYIIREISKNEELNFWNYPKFIREEMNNMIELNLLKSTSKLFSTPEKNYLNFFLNKKEFTNGFDLRNKYSHGTNSFSEETHRHDYYSFIKIIILTLLKIEDDIVINMRN